MKFDDPLEPWRYDALADVASLAFRLQQYADNMFAYENQSTKRDYDIDLIIGYEWVDFLESTDWYKWFARSYQFTQWAMAAVRYAGLASSTFHCIGQYISHLS